MSENEIKKNNSAGKPYLTPRKTIEKRPVQSTAVKPLPEKENDYFNDVEIFDIDAARRAKQEKKQPETNEVKKTEKTVLAKPPVFSKKELDLPDALGLTVEEKKKPDVNASESTMAFAKVTNSVNKAGVKGEEKEKKPAQITDIKSEKVIFNSSVQQDYVPEVKSSK